MCLGYPIIKKVNTYFQNLALSLFNIYRKISSCKKLRTSTEYIPRKMCHRHTETDRQSDRQTDRQRFDHVFQKFENKIFLNYLARLSVIWKESTQTKCQRYTVDWRSNQKPFHNYQYTKIIQSIYSIHQIICEIHLI